mgnify:CR=1 FL=1
MPGVPDVTEFPARTWMRLENRRWRHPEPELLSYAPGGGLPRLREALAAHLRTARSVVCEPEQLILTTGSHQSIDLTLRLLASPGEHVWLEDPCYWGLRSSLASLEARIVPVPVDAEGLAWQDGGPHPVPRAILVTPSHQYPLGMVMSLSRRRMLLEYAATHKVWIIEDDYDSEFRYGGRPLASLQGMDTQDRVLYMGTFSKIMFPGLRIGFLVVPESLAKAFATGIAELYRNGQVFLQATLADFMALTQDLNLRVDASAAFAGKGAARPMDPTSALENWRTETCLFMLSRNGGPAIREPSPGSGDLFGG